MACVPISQVWPSLLKSTKESQTNYKGSKQALLSAATLGWGLRISSNFPKFIFRGLHRGQSLNSCPARESPYSKTAQEAAGTSHFPSFQRHCQSVPFCFSVISKLLPSLAVPYKPGSATLPNNTTEEPEYQRKQEKDVFTVVVLGRGTKRTLNYFPSPSF